MCRQAWFQKGESARDPKTLEIYFIALEKSCGGHGNGAGWIDENGSFDFIKGVKLTNAKAAEFVANRPKNAWGIFHTRLASAGAKGTEGCHPHTYLNGDGSRLAMLTHNGTWPGWTGACLGIGEKYPSDSATIAALVAMYGWSRVASVVDETIICAIRSSKGVIVRAWKDTMPLVLLANGGIASEGGDGEFEAKQGLCKGGHRAEQPRTEKLSEYKMTKWSGRSGYTSAGWIGDMYGVGGYGGCSERFTTPEPTEVVIDESSDGLDRHTFASDEEMTDDNGESYIWIRGKDGSWRAQPIERKASDKKQFAPITTSEKKDYLLPGIEDVTEEIVLDMTTGEEVKS